METALVTRATLPRAAVIDPVDAETEGVAVRLDARTLRGRLAAVLVEIGNRDREVLLLVAWAQLSCEEAARALGIPAGTARSRLNRARKKTRAALPDADPGNTGKGDEASPACGRICPTSRSRAAASASPIGVPRAASSSPSRLRVRNAGDAGAAPVTVRFTDNGTTIGEALTPAIPAGESRTVSVTWSTGGIEGRRTIAVTADPADVVDEPVESNNPASRSVEIQAAG